MKDEKPKEVYQAVRFLAKAVKKASEMDGRPSLDPNERYYVVEYLPEMEELLLEQLITVSLDEGIREKVLEETGLDYLVLRLREKAADWEMLDEIL